MYGCLQPSAKQIIKKLSASKPSVLLVGCRKDPGGAGRSLHREFGKAGYSFFYPIFEKQPVIFVDITLHLQISDSKFTVYIQMLQLSLGSRNRASLT